MLQFDRISKRNLDQMVELLSKRNNTLPEYTRWKYGSFDDNFFFGVIAFEGTQPIGCIGAVPRVLQLNQEYIPCKWFADWYVIPDMRGRGIGKSLLNELAYNCRDIIWGHPGPKSALTICLENGYQKLGGLQRRRRLIFDRSRYEKLRTKRLSKYLYRMGFYTWNRLFLNLKRCLTSYEVADEYNFLPLTNNSMYFVNDSDYEAWYLAQPTRAHIKRRIGRWEYQDSKIIFVDDRIKTGETGRYILYAAGKQIQTPSAWHLFVQHAQDSGCNFIDFFTTVPALEKIWSNMGAIIIQESPIVVKGLDLRAGPSVYLHGWDRENWINRSME